MVVPHGLGLPDPGLCGFRCVQAVGGALSPVECCVEGFPGGAFAACEGGGLEESLLAPWGVFRVHFRGIGLGRDEDSSPRAQRVAYCQIPLMHHVHACREGRRDQYHCNHSDSTRR